MKTIFFYGHKNQYGWLSNFYPSKLYYMGRWWPTSEHAYQAMKSEFFKYQEYVREAKNPSKAKKRGREIEIRSDWEIVKYNIMIEILKAKFSNNTILLRKLLKTGNAKLVEKSPTDYIWGCGKDFSGKNLLGKALMEVREYLKEGK